MNGPVPWQAPYTAYLLTAAVADQDTAAADAIWKQMAKPAQADLLTALGAQARLAVVTTARHNGMNALRIDTTRLVVRVCEEVVRTMVELIKPEPGPWQLPECSHCTQLIARALIETLITLAADRGLTLHEYAEMCRSSATQMTAG